MSDDRTMSKGFGSVTPHTLQSIHFTLRAALWVIALIFFIYAAMLDTTQPRKFAWIGLAFGAVSEIMSVLWIARFAYWKTDAD